MLTLEDIIERKKELIEKIVKCPLDFNYKDFLELVTIGQDKEHKNEKIELNFDDLRKMVIRIFDINETTQDKGSAKKVIRVADFIQKKSGEYDTGLKPAVI